MVSKFVMKSILAVSLVFFMGQTAWAVISNTSTTQTSCTAKLRLAGLCSINVEGLLKGLGNVTNNPTAFSATLLIQEGRIFCKNPAGNSIESNGVPFTDVEVTLEGSTGINAADVSKNGRSLSDITFHDPDLIAAVEAGLNAQCNGGLGDPVACTQLEQLPCQHSNWIQTIVVTKLQVLGEQWTDPDTTTPACNLNDRNPDPLIEEIIIDTDQCTLADALGTKCDAPPAVVADPKSFIWKAFTYACTESCHDSTGTCTLPLP